jgi:predicted permease
MRWLDVLRLRLRSLFQSNGAEGELNGELQFHLEQQVEENLAQGMDPQEARYAALRAIGGIAQIKEECRDMRRVNFVDHLWQDLRYAARTMKRSPAFTVVAVLSLALGIGANTAIFSAIDALLLKRLPVSDPGRLLMFAIGDFRNFGYLWYESFRNRIASLDGIAATADFDESIDDDNVRVALVSGSYFPVLGVKAAMGRSLEPEDERGPHPVAMISDGYWQRKFARSSAVLDRTFTLNGVTYSIVGVAPRGFVGDWIAQPADIWIPASMSAEIAPQRPNLNMIQYWRILTRLKPGAIRQQAEAAATAINLDLRQEDARRRGLPLPPRIAQQKVDLASASHGFVPERRGIAQPLTILAVLAGLVLLIACANMANLLLARSAARQREIAVRLAFGAARGRIVRQVLTESIALAVAGGALGVWIAQAATGAMLKMMTSDVIPLRLELHPDARMLTFALLLSILTGVLFGMAPARNASRITVTPALAAGRDGSARKSILGKALVVSQVALSLVLVVGAGLFLRTLRNLKSQDFGLDRRHLLLIYTAPQHGARKGGAAYQKIHERISSLTGVVSVSEIGGSVLDPGYYWIDDSAALKIQGEPVKTGQPVTMAGVGPGFFSTAGAPLIAGRDFDARDLKGPEPAVAIVNRTFARFYFGAENPVGHRISRFGCNGPVCENQFPFEIVGVVNDINTISPRFQSVGMAYLPMAADAAPGQGYCVVVRTAEPAGPGWAAFARRQIHEAAPDVPVLRVLTVEQQLDETLATERLIGALCGAFGVLGVALAALGLYGVIAYTTARRTHEIGVRIALGASRVEVLRMVLMEGLVVAVAGVAIGIPATLAATRLIAKWMYGIAPGDPLTIAASAVLMIAVAALAAFIPARRAARVDPMVALRYE